LEKFLNLPDKKRKAIIDAAFAVFGRNGYKKASAADIAAEAGISKAMIFHYFGSKKAMYLYLAEFCGTTLVSGVDGKPGKGDADFFDRLKLITEIEISIMKKHPAMLSFLWSMYRETDPEVAHDVKGLISGGGGYRERIAFDGADVSMFKDGVNPELVLKFMSWASEGHSLSVSQTGSDPEMALDGMMRDFNDFLDVLKKHLCKQPFQKL